VKKVILIPDSFKGTMSSAEICTVMAASILQFYPGAEIVRIPVADGGEGSVDAFLRAAGGKKIELSVRGPFSEEVSAFYGILADGTTAVIEMAACSGLPLAEGRLDPLSATTYGVGQLIEAAVKTGCRKIILGLGGSATNDGGCGVAAALGVRFLDRAGKSFVPTGGTLENIQTIDTGGLIPELAGVEIVSMCDVDNPLYGETGAAPVFGPQKGASPQAVQKLDTGLRHLARIVRPDPHKDAALMPGSGAAGGMGYGMRVFLGSKLKMGIEAVLDAVDFDHLLCGADMVFTGEGKIDVQSLRGKVISGIARRTKKAGIPLVAVVGDIGDGIDAAYDRGLTAVFSINRTAIPFSEAKKRAKNDLRLTMDNIMRFSQAVERQL
jgi:glycerate kinase